MSLTQTAIFLAAAVVAVPLFKRLGLGAVLGYLAAGVIIGPSGLKLIGSDGHAVHDTFDFAEFGVVLLLFLIGLELEPRRLWKMRGSVFGLGGAQVALCTVVIMGVGMACGLSPAGACVAGLGLSMSSTAFATQILGERNELGVAHGRSAFGILLFQDLAAIPVLALVPLLAEAPAAVPGAPADGHAIRIVIAIVALTSVLVAGRFLLRPLLRFIASARSHELSTASALLVVVGMAMLMQKIGLSMALGSFLAGVLLADSEYRHELEANIEPFKGLLLGLFFIAVGMSAKLAVVVDEPLTVIALALVAVKAAILFGLGRFSKLPQPSAVSLAISISQGGEFAFVIFKAARGVSLMDDETLQLLIVVVTLSMAVTPLLFMARDAFEKRRLEAGEAARAFDEIHEDNSRVIIAGFGRFGQVVGRLLRVKKMRFTALDVSATHVDFIRKYGNQIYYGDAARVDLLRAAGAETAQLFVLAIDDVAASMKTLEAVQHHFPHLRVIARARNRQHAYMLYDAGVDLVIRETFAGSLDAARIALEELGLAPNDAREAVRRFGAYDEARVKSMASLRNDETALIAAAATYAQELERVMEEDVARS